MATDTAMAADTATVGAMVAMVVTGIRETSSLVQIAYALLAWMLVPLLAPWSGTTSALTLSTNLSLAADAPLLDKDKIAQQFQEYGMLGANKELVLCILVRLATSVRTTVNPASHSKWHLNIIKSRNTRANLTFFPRTPSFISPIVGHSLSFFLPLIPS